ncbi:MAG: ribonuclease P [Nanoarchaeota archaeon]|nr:ribonuclease P [Nanoarchaeota archaeon]
MPARRRKKGYGRKPDDTIKIAKQHIESLLEQAKEVAAENTALANRYVTLARKVAMKFRIRLPPEQKRLFCPHCYRFMLPGKNLRVRVHEHRVIYYCLDCKKFWRKPLGKALPKDLLLHRHNRARTDS